jgi:DNA-binding transcriptional LysR family regulator
MFAKPVDWSDLQLLAALRGKSSMLGAANQLGLAASTVSRRLTALEGAAGATLLQRGPDGVRFTEAGRALADWAADMDGGLARTLRSLPVGGGALTGTVRVSAGDGFADVIVSAVRAMAASHPGVAFELAFESQTVSLTRGEADVAVRTVHQRESSLVYRKVATLQYGLFAAASYLAGRGTPRRLPDLARHAFVGYAAPLDRLPSERWLRARVGRPPAVATSSYAALLTAARAGLGLVSLPIASAAGLVPVLRGAELPARPVWLVVQREVRKQPHVAAFVEVLRAELEREAARSPQLQPEAPPGHHPTFTTTIRTAKRPRAPRPTEG